MQKAINQFGVHRNTAYQALKDACDDLLQDNSAIKALAKRGISSIINHAG